MRRAGSTGDVGDEVRDRLGVYRLGERRAIAAVVELLAEEHLEAVGAGMWEWRGWVVVATDGGACGWCAARADSGARVTSASIGPISPRFDLVRRARV